MKRCLPIILVLIFGVSLTAQHEHLNPCGSPAVKSEWLKKYQLHPESYETSRNEIIYVPLAVHMVGEDNGTKFMSDIALQTALCTLNDDFEQANIHFYLGKEIRYIADSRYAEHETVLQGAQMMFEYNDPAMINCYFMSDAASNCGYNLPYAGMCISISCAGLGDHTWAHEMGHQLSLPHPFLGWEGGVSFDGSVTHNFDNPAPEKVLYDYTFFKDTLILDTMIIDTAYVEKMDGSNCMFAADGFCDTAPDYLAGRWACDASNNSITEQTDPDGVKFFSDGSLIMSYATDNCSSRFSDGQILAMRANLIDEKGHLLGNENTQEPVTATVLENPSPTDLELVHPENIDLAWDPVENATLYLVQLSFQQSFGLPVFDTIVSAPSVTIPSLQFATRDHYWRVKAFNDYNFCADWLEGEGSFSPSESVNIQDATAESWRVYPTVVHAESMLNIEAEGTVGQLELNILTTTGRTVYTMSVDQKRIDLSHLAPGIYLVHLRDEKRQYTQKIIIQ